MRTKSDFKSDILRGRVNEQMTFSQKVWALTARIPEGKVTTYAHLARALKTSAYRAVGNAMNKNPYAPTVPCHRVVGTSGSLTGYAHGLPKKLAMLKREGVPFAGEVVDLEKALWEPK
jgi:methylated-DNA-[protein]-cysteine S-methyltransferase